MKNTQETNPYEKKVLIIKSHVKQWINEKGFFCKAETYRAVNDSLIELLEKAIIRTKFSRIKTVSPKDV